MVTLSHHWPFVRQRKDPLSRSAIGWVALGVAIAGGSTFNGFAKVLTGVLSPLTLLCISEVLTLTFVALTFGLVPTARRLATLSTKNLRGVFILGLLAGVAAPLLWFTGLRHTEAINASFFGRVETVFLIVLAHVMLRECFSRGHALAATAIIGGVLTIVFQGFTQSINLNPGDMLILTAAFCYASANIVFRKYLSDMAPELVLFCRSSIAIGAFFLVSPFLEHPLIEEMSAFPVTLVPALIGFGFLSRFLNSFSFFEAIERLPVSTVSLVGSLEVVGGAVFAYFYVGEPLYWYHMLGGALILGGTVMLELAGATCSVPDTIPATAAKQTQ